MPTESLEVVLIMKVDLAYLTYLTHLTHLTYLVITAKEFRIVKEVISCDVSPVAMFRFKSL